MKGRLGENGEVWLELKFHKVDNFHYLEGPQAAVSQYPTKVSGDTHLVNINQIGIFI